MRRQTDDVFDETYETTVGVRIDHARLNGTDVVFWDLPAEDRFQSLVPSHLRRTSGLLMVADVTRAATLPAVLELEARAARIIGPVPAVIILNKIDRGSRDINLSALESLHQRSVDIFETSARTGHGVRDAFLRVVQKAALAV